MKPCDNNPRATPRPTFDPCDYYAETYQAYMKLMAGEQTAQVRHGERWTTYHRGNAADLRRELRRLEIVCDPNRPRTVQATGPNPAGPGFGLFGRRGYW